ncbi:hypothetical protein [uncultured Roseobacter sp.]|uniref:hypothetical protein n=1 Tax=uncultured Roseobacter sp. TaxID=114847 RepID=UPI002611ADB7|nr:hypothetical protein [uncultured Roseobacter sp.]
MQGLQSGKKSFGIMRVAKVKNLGNMGASLSHTFRERETPNADPDRMKDNTVLVGGTTTKEVLADWHYRAPEKIRMPISRMHWIGSRNGMATRTSCRPSSTAMSAGS